MFGVDSALEKPSGNLIAKAGSLSQSVRLRIDSNEGRYPNLLNLFVIQMVASAMEVDADQVRTQPRGNTKLCRARQVAMYLMHVTLGISYKEIGKIFRKDRTTVSYACGVIEELRDVPIFDERMNELEQILSTVLKMLPGK